MMPYFVYLPSGKYGQFDVATAKFVDIDMSSEDVWRWAGVFAAALGLSFDCEKIASGVVNGATADEKQKDAPYCEQAKHGVRRYVGCIQATMNKHGKSMARRFALKTLGTQSDSDVFPPGFWLNGIATKVRPIVGVSTPQEKVCVGYVVKRTVYNCTNSWLYLSVSTLYSFWYPGQNEACRFTRSKAREVVRVATDEDLKNGGRRTFKVVRLMRRLP